MSESEPFDLLDHLSKEDMRQRILKIVEGMPFTLVGNHYQLIDRDELIRRIKEEGVLPK